MIPMTAIREEFGLARRLTPSSFYSALELQKGITHYFFRSVRGVLPDLLTTCVDAEESEFAVVLLEAVALQIAAGKNPPAKFGLSVANPFGFDAVLAVPSPYHGHLKGVLNEKHATLVWCVPIHCCEFTGNETSEEFRQWQTRVGVERWKRPPYPFIAMEFENPRSSYGSPMERTSYDACMTNLASLKGVTKGFAKLVNYHGDAILIKPIRNQRYSITVNTKMLECSFDELMALVSAFVMTGAKPRSTM